VGARLEERGMLPLLQDGLGRVSLNDYLCSAFIISPRRVRNFSPASTGVHDPHSPGH
jgi:hypothetical protein